MELAMLEIIIANEWGSSAGLTFATRWITAILYVICPDSPKSITTNCYYNASAAWQATTSFASP